MTNIMLNSTHKKVEVEKTDDKDGTALKMEKQWKI